MAGKKAADGTKKETGVSQPKQQTQEDGSTALGESFSNINDESADRGQDFSNIQDS